MKRYNIHEAKTHFSRLVDAAAAGEEILISKAGRPMARLVPASAGGARRTLGALAGRIAEAADCWAPDAELEAQFYGAPATPVRSRKVAERKRP